MVSPQLNLSGYAGYIYCFTGLFLTVPLVGRWFTTRSITGLILAALGGIFFWLPQAESSGQEISLALLPEKKYTTDHNAQWQDYQQYFKDDHYDQDLLLMPESAYRGLIEHGPAIENLTKEISAGQSLLVGADRQEFAKDGFATYNSAYFIAGKRFDYQIRKKEFLTPGAEYSSPINAKLNLPLANYALPDYARGESVILHYRDYQIAVAICLEALIDRWYAKMAKQGADAYFVLAREYRLPKFTQKKVDAIARLKMAQTNKPWAKVSAGGSNTISNPPQKPQNSPASQPLVGYILINDQQNFSFAFNPYMAIVWLVGWFFLVRAGKS